VRLEGRKRLTSFSVACGFAVHSFLSGVMSERIVFPRMVFKRMAFLASRARRHLLVSMVTVIMKIDLGGKMLVSAMDEHIAMPAVNMCVRRQERRQHQIESGKQAQ
jgi:hypothetical protein